MPVNIRPDQRKKSNNSYHSYLINRLLFISFRSQEISVFGISYRSVFHRTSGEPIGYISPDISLVFNIASLSHIVHYPNNLGHIKCVERLECLGAALEKSIFDFKNCFHCQIDIFGKIAAQMPKNYVK